MTWRALALLAAYLVLFPPLFVLGPLAGLLVASRPRTVREWTWIGAAVLWLLVRAGQSGGLATQMLHAWALFVTGAFVVLMLPGRRPLVPGALLATVFGFGAASAWAWLLGSRWHDVQLAVAHTGWELSRQILAQGGLGTGSLESVQTYAAAMTDVVGVIAELFPAVLVLMALPGLALAWTWYHRLAANPAGQPGGRFAEFRFTDQMIWLVVVSAAAYLIPMPVVVQGAVGNLAMIAGGLYAARGAAVTWGSIQAFPLPVLIVLSLGLLFILPVALGGWFAIGLADTWVDFRRRFRSAESREE